MLGDRMFGEFTLDGFPFVRCEPPKADGRVLLLGGVNGRKPPRFPGCVADG
jgi:hypothetical protein